MPTAPAWLGAQLRSYPHWPTSQLPDNCPPPPPPPHPNRIPAPQADHVVALVAHLWRVGHAQRGAAGEVVEARRCGWLPVYGAVGILPPAWQQFIQGGGLQHIARQDVGACSAGGRGGQGDHRARRPRLPLESWRNVRVPGPRACSEGAGSYQMAGLCADAWLASIPARGSRLTHFRALLYDAHAQVFALLLAQLHGV